MKFAYKNKTFDIESISEDDHIYNIIKNSNSFYEKRLLEYMLFLTFFSSGKNTLSIDVGANIGNHSIYMKTFLSEHLIAIEPNPQVLKFLSRNLEKNIDNYSIYDCAVGEQDGLGSVVLPEGSDNNFSMAKIVSETQGDSVRISTLDSIVNQWQALHDNDCNISIIKIDVEGMELSVLRGATSTLEKYKPHIFAEAATTDRYQEIEGFLKTFGYQKISRWCATPVYHFAHQPTLTLLFFTRSITAVRSLFQSIKKVKRVFAN